MAKASVTTPSADYDGDAIDVLEGLEPVRKRPGMYVGGTGSRAMNHCLLEVVDNAIDEALAGFCTEIVVELAADGTMSVTDNGRGIPVSVNKKTGQPAVMLVFEVLHAGGKFGGGGYKVAGGLHGVGASVTNALAEWLQVEVTRDGHVHQARWAKGVRTQDLKKVRKAPGTGTKVTWQPDRTIFDPGSDWNATAIRQTLQEKAYLVPGLKITFAQEGHSKAVFHSRKGLAEMVSVFAEERKPIHPVLSFSTGDAGVPVTLADGRTTNIVVDTALQWTVAADERIHAFANIVPTHDGGEHVTGFKQALTKALNRYAHDTGKLKKDAKKGPERFDGRDVTAALTAAVLVKLENPSFAGQTKGKLNNAEARTAATAALYEPLCAWLENPKNGKDAKAILDRCLHARKVRLAESKADKSYDPTHMAADSGQSDKLADCDPSCPVEERELYIVEGDSAGGTARKARDSYNQAILPLRGKPLNVVGASNEAIYKKNAEVKALIAAMGGRVDAIEGEFVATLRRDARRYGKIVICADADADGAHITALVVALIDKVMPDMIAEGRVFVAKPPLFGIALDKRGDKRLYAYSDEERSALLKKHKRTGEDVARFKGLGEMEAYELAETVMTPATRSLFQVQVTDPTEFEETLLLLFSNKQKMASRRREWLEEEAPTMLQAM